MFPCFGSSRACYPKGLGSKGDGSNRMRILTVAVFVTGFATGCLLCLTHICLLKARLRCCESFIRRRMEQQMAGLLGKEQSWAPAGSRVQTQTDCSDVDRQQTGWNDLVNHAALHEGIAQSEL